MENSEQIISNIKNISSASVDHNFIMKINTVLSALNQLDYNRKIFASKTASEILMQLTNKVPILNENLFIQFCSLILNILNRQKLSLEDGADCLVEYLLKGLNIHNKSLSPLIFETLSCVIYENSANLEHLHQKILTAINNNLEHKDVQTQIGLIRCLTNLTSKSNNGPPPGVYLSEDNQRLCIIYILKFLQRPKGTIYMEDYCRILICCFKGIQQLINSSNSFPIDLLSPLLAAIQSLMVHGHSGISTSVSLSLQNLYPPEVLAANQLENLERNKIYDSASNAIQSNNSRSQATKKTKKKNKNKLKESNVKSQQDKGLNDLDEDLNENIKSKDNNESENIVQLDPIKLGHDESFWKHLAASDSSGNSDVETKIGSSHSLAVLMSRVRIQTLACFDALIKVIEKRVMLGYWWSFIPDSTVDVFNKHPLFAIIVKDPFFKVRCAGLGVLSSLLDGSKPYLMSAKEGDQYQNVAYTPFSASLCGMIKEMHRSLLILLSTEKYPIVVIQVLKCLAILISNSPYHRLKPGLLSKAVKQIRPYLSHRDSNVRVASLTSLGCVMTINVPLFEVLQIISPKLCQQYSSNFLISPHFTPKKQESLLTDICSIKTDFNSQAEPVVSISKESIEKKEVSTNELIDSGMNSCECSNSIFENIVGYNQRGSRGFNYKDISDISTPMISSGAESPGSSSWSQSSATLDNELVLHSEMSWILKICIKFVAPELLYQTRKINPPESIRSLHLLSNHNIASPELEKFNQDGIKQAKFDGNNLGSSKINETHEISFFQKNIVYIHDEEVFEINKNSEDFKSKEINIPICSQNSSINSNNISINLDRKNNSINQSTDIDHLTLSSSSFKQAITVRLESLQLLSSVAKGYFIVIRPHLFLIKRLIHICLHDQDCAIQLHTLKLLENLGLMILQSLNSDNLTTSVSINEAYDFWISMLTGPIQSITMESTDSLVKSTGCMCLANIGSQIFTKLPQDKYIFCITLILGLAADENMKVKIGAIHTLGQFVTFQCLRDDISFLPDAAIVMLDAGDDSRNPVLWKASWALSNLSDSLVFNRKDEEFMIGFSDKLLLRLIQTSCIWHQRYDKTRCYILRTIGNLLHFIRQESLETKLFDVAIANSLQLIIKNISSGTFKIRWNACHAVSNILKNENLLQKYPHKLAEIWSSLSVAVKSCKNFKVRINAALSLGCSPSKKCMSTSYYTILESVVQAFVSLDGEFIDYIEFKYKDTLVDRLTITLFNLLKMTSCEDLAFCSHLLDNHKDTLFIHLSKCLSRNRRDKDESLLFSNLKSPSTKLKDDGACSDKEDDLLNFKNDYSAKAHHLMIEVLNHLNEFKKQRNFITPEQLNFLEVINAILNKVDLISSDNDEDEVKLIKTAFRKLHD